MNEHSLLIPSGASVSHGVRPLLTRPDPIWRTIRDEALAAIEKDPSVEPLFQNLVLRHQSLEAALMHTLAGRLCDCSWGADAIEALFTDIAADHDVLPNLAADMTAVYDRDPACHRYVEPLLFFKGFQALQTQRFANALWAAERQDMALFLQSKASAAFQVDIHPATRIGGGVFLDHATGIVIGETALIEDNVSILQGVTLGGTGKQSGDRHPKVRCGVLVGAGAKVLGNIELGHGAKVAASSVVLDPVPPLATVAGIPAKIVGRAEPEGPDCMPSLSMDHTMPQEPMVDVGFGI
ncbi:MAG: serine O-acetyltransferase [Pseudomonadota bacterium]